MSRSDDGTRGANARNARNLEGCQCQGPVGPRATTKPVRTHVRHTRLDPACFETILMVAERIKPGRDWETIGEPACTCSIHQRTRSRSHN